MLASKTGVDSLAVGIGTAHGFYKEKPKINIMRLKEVNAAVDIPLVLHGGTGVLMKLCGNALKTGWRRSMSAHFCIPSISKNSGTDKEL